MRFAFLILAFVLALAACSRDGADGKEAVPGVRLGMTPRDVRDRFQPGGSGSWQTALGTGDDTVLEWTSRDTQSLMQTARFEFHLAMLVAIRARTREAQRAEEQVSLTPKTVIVRMPANEGGTSIVVLARDCPTHRDEAEGFAARAR